jgi:hypothetical protein
VQRGTPENPNESSWDALQRISEERGYRCFVLRNRVYYAREQDLIRSRPRLTISEDTPGVYWIDGQWVPNARVNTATVSCAAGLWAAPPGSSVVIEKTGPLSGRWLVNSFTRDRYNPDARIELRRGTELLKPQPIEKTSKSSTPAAPSSTPALPVEQVARVRLDSRWNGTLAIFEQIINPYLERFNLRPGSQKRDRQNTATGGTSDHWTGSRSSYAIDYPTFDGARAATALARGLGQPNWRPGTYNRFEIRVSGRRFSVQILWAVEGHFDHIHVGLRAI